MHHHLRRLLLAVYFGSWICYFAWFWSHAIFINQTGGLSVGHINMWGDWAAHFTMGSRLAYGNLWSTQSPLLINATFSYPYAANWLSAVLIRLGWPFWQAFTVLSFGWCVVGIFSLYYFYRTLFNSTKQAIIASLIFLWNGGVGWYYFGQDILASPQPWMTVLNPPHEYTRLDVQHLKWISVIDSMFIPQRAFTMGFPLTLLALAWVYSALVKDADHPRLNATSHLSKLSRHWLKLGGAALILGLMPIIHTHSFLAAGIILSSWLLGTLWVGRHRQLFLGWLVFGVVTVAIATPIFTHFFLNQVSDHFTKWYPGWLATEFKMNWWLFWFKNWGITPIMAVIGWVILLMKRVTHRSQKIPLSWFVFLPFFVIFIALNLFLFQPFAWDNTKLLVWASVGFSGLASVVLIKLWTWWSPQRHAITSILTKSLAIILFVVMTASGFIDCYWDVRTDLHNYQLYSPEELALSEWVKTNTPADAVWLTGDSHNHWLFNLTGRQTLMTYRGWLWTHGYQYQPVEADVSLMFFNPSRYRSLFAKYQVKYVVIGPNEKTTWHANSLQFQQEFTVIKQTPHFLLLQVD